MADIPHLSLQLDFRSGLPIYLQIVNQIEQHIISGVLKPGFQLPTVRTLALDLGVNFNTVARAYRALDMTHVLSTQQGRGTYILEAPPAEMTGRLRQDALQALAKRYVTDAKRIKGTNKEITVKVQEQLRVWKEGKQAKQEQRKN